MASYLRPRRGKRATAEAQNIILKKGEVFFEAPETGVGTGIGKIKIGDGNTPYRNLPYFLKQVEISTETVAFTESATTSNEALLNEILSGSSLSSIIGSMKKLLRNLNSGKMDVKKAIIGTTDPGVKGGLWLSE